MAQPTITREPEHPGYEALVDADNWGEDFYLLVDGERIGGTYWCSATYIKDGERLASYGPASLSMLLSTYILSTSLLLPACCPRPAPAGPHGRARRGGGSWRPGGRTCRSAGLPAHGRGRAGSRRW